MFEFFFLGLRKTAGVELSQFRRLFETSVDLVYPGLVPKLLAQGLLVEEGDTLFLSHLGLRLADSVIEQFVVES
jgi:oxygen-independent coproporphyrinogen-3 oxidase